MKKVEIFWVSRDDVALYNKDEHSKKITKLLFWDVSPAIIIAGNEPASHKSLANMFFNRAAETKNINAAFNKKPIGGGSVIRPSFLSPKAETEIAWYSEGFKIQTPENLQEIIKILLGIEKIKNF